MKLSVLTALAAFSCLAAVIYADTDPAASALAALAKKTTEEILNRLDAQEVALRKQGLQATCTRKNIAYRQEFRSMAEEDRKAYTDAVLCLQKKQPLTPAVLAPGSKSRFDDFVATHINQTGFIHYSGTFLGWHRNFVWEYEKALRSECGYTGYQPYWEWSLDVDAPQDSPIFNGDAYSMGGNGEFIPDHPGLVLVAPANVNPTIYLEPGFGGGCVQNGPFGNMTVNLGPVGLPNATAGPDGGLGYNPRCLKRDVGPDPLQRWNNFTRVYGLLIKNPTIYDFQSDLEGPLGTGDIGPHGGGHFTISGDPGADLFTSPGDPAFYIHHGQIDRMWTLWQGIDPVTRQFALSGTNTMLNMPPSANTTLDFKIGLGFAAGSPIAMQDVMSTTAGPFCYLYV